MAVLTRYHEMASACRREALLNEGHALARIRSLFVAPWYEVESQRELWVPWLSRLSP